MYIYIFVYYSKSSPGLLAHFWQVDYLNCCHYIQFYPSVIWKLSETPTPNSMCFYWLANSWDTLPIDSYFSHKIFGYHLINKLSAEKPPGYTLAWPFEVLRNDVTSEVCFMQATCLLGKKRFISWKHQCIMKQPGTVLGGYAVYIIYIYIYKHSF